MDDGEREDAGPALVSTLMMAVGAAVFGITMAVGIAVVLFATSGPDPVRSDGATVGLTLSVERDGNVRRGVTTAAPGDTVSLQVTADPGGTVAVHVDPPGPRQRTRIATQVAGDDPVTVRTDAGQVAYDLGIVGDYTFSACAQFGPGVCDEVVLTVAIPVEEAP